MENYSKEFWKKVVRNEIETKLVYTERMKAYSDHPIS